MYGLQHTEYGRLNGVGMWLTFWANCPLRRVRQTVVHRQPVLHDEHVKEQARDEWRQEMEWLDSWAFGYRPGEDRRPLPEGYEALDMRPEAPDYDTRELDVVEKVELVLTKGEDGIWWITDTGDGKTNITTSTTDYAEACDMLKDIQRFAYTEDGTVI